MMTAPVIAVLMGASAFLVPIRRDRESGRLIFAMNWDQAVRNIGWGIIVLQIGAIAFGQVLLKGGVDKWMAQCIQMLLGDIHGLLVWFALVFITGFFSQIRIRQLTKNRRHIFQWSARQIIMMKLRKFWIAVLFQRQHFAKIGRECFFRPMLKLRHAVIMNLCNRGLQIEV